MRVCAADALTAWAKRTYAGLCAPSRRGAAERVARAALGAVFLVVRVAERSVSATGNRGGAPRACACVGCACVRERKNSL